MISAQLVEVNKAISVCLTKLGQKPRALRNYSRLLRQGERKLMPRIKEWIDETIKEVRAGLSRMRGKTATQKTKSIADWSAIEANGIAILKPTLLELLSEGGKTVVERRILKQQRFDPIGVEAINWANAHTANLVAEITQETIAGIRDVITTGLNTGLSIPTIARELRPIVGLNSQYAGAVANFQTKLLAEGVAAQKASAKAEVYANRLHRKRAATIARTETAFALTEGQRQGYGQMGVKQLERVEDPATEDDDCADNNGRIYSLAEAQGVLPAHPNCLPGDSLVLPCGSITGASKRWFEGEIIIFKTASNRKLSCTPHHPILTEFGFVPANSLDVESNVISHGLSQRERFVDWHNINKPTTLQKISDSFFKSEGVTTRRMPTSAMDFHGDGEGSKITVIGTNSFLMDCLNSSLSKHSFEFDLVVRKIRRILLDRFSMFAFRFPSYFHSFSGNMSRLNLKSALISRHLFPNNFYSFGLASDLNFSLQQSPMNDRATNIKQLGDGFFRMPRNIKMNDALNGKFIMAKFPKLISFPWFLDEIIHKEISNYKGYVYNLETTKSYYIANGIATHNCEGTWVAA